MALISRLSRLFRADFHAVLDSIEEPDVLLKQAVREMQESVAKEEQQKKALAQECSRLVTKESDLEQALDQIEEELDVCFASNKEDLAHALIKRRLETQRRYQSMARRRCQLDEEITRMGERLSENRARLEAMEQKLAQLVEQDAAPSFSLEVADVTVTPEEVEVAFLKEKQRRRQS